MITEQEKREKEGKQALAEFQHLYRQFSMWQRFLFHLFIQWMVLQRCWGKLIWDWLIFQWMIDEKIKTY